jgi:hypothetical protein
VDPIDLGQDNDRWLAVVNTAMKITYPQNNGIFLNSRGTLNFSRTLLHRVSLGIATYRR